MSVCERYLLDIGIAVYSGRRRRQARQIALQQDRGGHTIDGAFALLPTHISGDQQVLRRLGRHPLVPEDDRHRQALFQTVGELSHRLNRRPFPSVQLKRKPQDHLSDFVGIDQRRDMFDIPIKGAALKRLERLRGPAQLIAEGDPDPLGSVIEGQDTSALHKFTAAAPVQPDQRPFPARDPVWPDPSLPPAPSPAARRRFHPLRPP